MQGATQRCTPGATSHLKGGGGRTVDGTHHATPCLQAGDGRRAQVVSCSQGATSALRLDQLCHSAVYSTARSQEELSQLLQLRLGQYTEAAGYGLLLLLWSVLLSHSVE